PPHPRPTNQVTPSAAPALPQAPESKGTEATEESKDEAADANAIWVKVIRGAMVRHSTRRRPIPADRSPGRRPGTSPVGSQRDASPGGRQKERRRARNPAGRYEPIDRPSGKRVAVQEPQAPVDAAPAPSGADTIEGRAARAATAAFPRTSG